MNIIELYYEWVILPVHAFFHLRHAGYDLLLLLHRHKVENTEWSTDALLSKDFQNIKQRSKYKHKRRSTLLNFTTGPKIWEKSSIWWTLIGFPWLPTNHQTLSITYGGKLLKKLSVQHSINNQQAV